MKDRSENDDLSYDNLAEMVRAPLQACEVCARWEDSLSTLKLAWELDTTRLCSECVAELGYGIKVPRRTATSAR